METSLHPDVSAKGRPVGTGQPRRDRRPAHRRQAKGRRHPRANSTQGRSTPEAASTVAIVGGTARTRTARVSLETQHGAPHYDPEPNTSAASVAGAKKPTGKVLARLVLGTTPSSPGAPHVLCYRRQDRLRPMSNVPELVRLRLCHRGRRPHRSHRPRSRSSPPRSRSTRNRATHGLHRRAIPPTRASAPRRRIRRKYKPHTSVADRFLEQMRQPPGRGRLTHYAGGGVEHSRRRALCPFPTAQGAATTGTP